MNIKNYCFLDKLISKNALEIFNSILDPHELAAINRRIYLFKYLLSNNYKNIYPIINNNNDRYFIAKILLLNKNKKNIIKLQKNFNFK